jgi:predicted metal-dependent hydrolase
MLRLFRRITTKPAPVTSFDIAHAGEIYRVAVKRSATARRMILRVRATSRDVVLTMPTRGSLAAAREFTERHGSWIGARLRRLPRPVLFVPGAVVPLRGVDHVIVYCPGRRGTVWIEPHGAGGFALCVAGGLAHVPRRVTDYLKSQARRDLEAAVAHYTRAIDRPARRVTLRDTTSRWGSCSAKGGLNFSWRLILAPSFVLDYLAAHEVAHLVHMNHSARYWKLTRSLCPDTDRAEAWLSAQGSSLYKFGKGEPVEAG